MRTDDEGIGKGYEGHHWGERETGVLSDHRVQVCSKE